MKITLDDLKNKCGYVCNNGSDWFTINKLYDIYIPLNSKIRVSTEFEFNNISWLLKNAYFINTYKHIIFVHINKIELYNPQTNLSIKCIDYSYKYNLEYDTTEYTFHEYNYNIHGICINTRRYSYIIDSKNNMRFTSETIHQITNDINNVNDITELVILNKYSSNTCEYIKNIDGNYLELHTVYIDHSSDIVVDNIFEYNESGKLTSHICMRNGIIESEIEYVYDKLNRPMLYRDKHVGISEHTTIYNYYLDSDHVSYRNENHIYDIKFIEEQYKKSIIDTDEKVCIGDEDPICSNPSPSPIDITVCTIEIINN
jgi:hypothetical protein